MFLNAEPQVTRIVDLIKMKSIRWNEEDQGVTFEYEDIPANLQDLAEEWHNNLVESAAEASEELMDKYLGGEELTEAEIKAALRKRVLDNEIELCHLSLRHQSTHGRMLSYQQMGQLRF